VAAADQPDSPEEGIIVLPFSFVLDTILLRYTIPKTITNYLTEEGKSEQGGETANATDAERRG
jgi:hypothetical protein